MKKIYQEKIFQEMPIEERTKLPAYICNLSPVSMNNSSLIMTHSEFYNKTNRFFCHPYFKHISR